MVSVVSSVNNIKQSLPLQAYSLETWDPRKVCKYVLSMSHFSKPFEVFYFGHIKSQSSYSGLKYSITSASGSTSLWPELSHCCPVLACAEKHSAFGCFL